MFKGYFKKFLSSLISVLPVVAIVLVLYLVQITTNHFENEIISNELLITFAISSFCLVIGMSLFSIGSDVAIGEVGRYLGASFAKQKNLFLVIILMLLLGFLITIAEPDVSVLAGYIPKESLDPTFIKIAIGIGSGIFFILGFIRIMFQKPLKLWYTFFFLLIFGIACLFGDGDGAIIDLSFDSGAVTTGPITVPFFIAFGVGIAGVRGGKDSSTDSFGITAFCSIGPIMVVMLLGLFLKPHINPIVLSVELTTTRLLECFTSSLLSVSIALLPIIGFFVVYELIVIKLPKNELLRILVGFIYTYIGLVIFLTAANFGFIPIGNALGRGLAASPNDHVILLIISVLLGLVIVLVEPGVQILSTQVEEISNGVISKKKMLASLASGVSLAILLSTVRIVYLPNLSLLYFLVPLYSVVFILALIVPDIYTAIAFDAGEVASGLMASSFVLPFVLGVSAALGGVNSGFGVIGMIACMPVVTVQVMGLYAQIKTNIVYSKAMKRVITADDLQIIHFDKAGEVNE